MRFSSFTVAFGCLLGVTVALVCTPLAQAAAAVTPQPSATVGPAATTGTGKATGNSATTGAKAAPKDDTLTPLQKEKLRIRKVMEWAQKTNPTQKELWQYLYKPVIDGNTKDAVANQKVAESYSKKAATAEEDRQPKGAEKYREIARLYVELAQLNQAVLAAIAQINGPQVEIVFDKIQSLEAKITNLTGKSPARDWLMPNDFTIASVKSASATPGNTKAGAGTGATTPAKSTTGAVVPQSATKAPARKQ